MSAETISKLSESPAPQKVLLLLDDFKRTRTGAVVHQHIRHILEESEATHTESARAYASLLGTLLNAYAQQLPADSLLRTHIKLVQMRLMPPLLASEFAALRRYIEVYATDIRRNHREITETLIEALSPLLEDFGVNVEEAAETTPERAHTTHEAPAPLHVAQRVDQAYRQHLDAKHKGMQEIQETLAGQIVDAIHQNEEFSVRLEIASGRLQRAGSITILNTLRQMLVNETKNILDSNRALGEQLSGAHNHLKTIQSDTQQLNDELTRVHLLSLTDELTNLPNRRAFMRRLEDEVARVQRYGNPLTLAIIDLDDFKSINDKLGHAAGDEVLRSFASNVLSTFRHHDMVTRYGGEEFAILLPNTDSEGAMHALRKVQKRAAESSYMHGNAALPMPTFSAGIALHKPGETPSNLIERADSALYRAKHLGRNRLEVDAASGAHIAASLATPDSPSAHAD
ncbi:MAG: diguanylate cyclase [Gammaproteobacteria bacterium]